MAALSNARRLVIASGSAKEDVALADKVLRVLQDVFHIAQAEVWKPVTQKDLPKGSPRDQNMPFILGRFPDGELQMEIGHHVLEHTLKNAYCVFLKYLLNPEGNTPDENLREVKAFFDIAQTVNPFKMTLVSPYFPYIRAHSVEKYREKGRDQYNALRMMIREFHDNHIDEIIGIDWHSEKIKEYCQVSEVGCHFADPFQSSDFLHPGKFGFEKGYVNKDFMDKLQPFLTYFRQHKERYKDVCFVAPDAGAENRVEHFAGHALYDSMNPHAHFERILYVEKDRITAGVIEIMGFKRFGWYPVESISGETVYIIIDDMISSGGSADEVGAVLKSKGAKKVELWCSHPVCAPAEKVRQLAHLDAIVTLPTIPQSIERLTFIDPSVEHLLAANIFKSYGRGIAKY